MKYVITGGAGNISKPLAEHLLKAGHQVTVIGRNADHLKPLTDLGAKPAIGSVEDVSFLIKTFAGADAVYVMIPPNNGAPDLKAFMYLIGKNYTEAIRTNGIKYVVTLSSIGAHLPKGAGPVSGIHHVEKLYNTLTDVNILHLRPGYFFTNFLGSIDMIKHMNIIGNNFGPEEKLIVVYPPDIAPVAAEALLSLNFKGHNIRYIASDERTPTDIAKVLGSAVGKPELPWVTFTDEQALEGMLQAGFPQEIASNYRDMGQSIQSGKMFEDYWKNRPELSKTKLEDFAKVFAAAYKAS